MISEAETRIVEANGPLQSAGVDCILIALCWTIPALLLRPFQNAPFVDDWTYAWPVEWLFRHHELKVLEWSSSLNVSQALWGALFCLPGGFSFAPLRVSTWVLAGACLCGLYLLLRQLKVSRKGSILGTAILGLHPVFFHLSFTFMTDVPFLTMLVWSAFAVVRGLDTKKNGWFLAAAVFASISISIRPVGIAVPAAIACLVLFRRKQFKLSYQTIVVVAVPLVTTALLLWWWKGHQQVTVDIADYSGTPKTRLASLRYALPNLPASFLAGLLSVAAILGIAVLPLSAALVKQQMLRRCGMIFAGLLALTGVAHLFKIDFVLPLSSACEWEWNGLNGSMELVPGCPDLPNPAFLQLIFIIGLASTANMLALLSSEVTNAPRAFLVTLQLMSFSLIVVLWLFHDRYLMVMFPFAIALCLLRYEPRLRIALPLIAIFALYSLVGTYNTLKYNEALWKAVADLRSRGAKDSEIDAGYVVDGWLQFAHPENAPRGKNGEIFVPGLTSSTESVRYEISNHQEQDERLINSFVYPQWFRPSGILYVLESKTR